MEKLIETFGSMSKALELFLLLEGHKPVVRQGFYERERVAVEDFCKKNTLFLVGSEFKVRPVEWGYSDKGFRSYEGMRFVYISKDELLANQASLFEIKGDHFNFGRLLGYPECCCRFFEQQFPIRSRLDNRYEKPVLDASKHDNYPFCMNIFRRSADRCILSHFPCSLDCGESSKLAARYYRILEQHHPGVAQELKNQLSKPMILFGRPLDFSQTI